VTDDRGSDGAKEAVKTYIEQTKLLVTLSSAFVLAPAGAVAVFKDRAVVGLSTSLLFWFVVADVLFILSVLMGYVVLGTISGFQHINRYDVHRAATRWSSLFQILTYLAGLVVFIYFAFALISAPQPKPYESIGSASPMSQDHWAGVVRRECENRAAREQHFNYKAGERHGED
jgi:hypothetical protein